jgi:hypothetical protein
VRNSTFADEAVFTVARRKTEMKTAWAIGLISAAMMAAQAEPPLPAVTVYVSSDPGVPRAVELRARGIGDLCRHRRGGTADRRGTRT